MDTVEDIDDCNWVMKKLEWLFTAFTEEQHENYDQYSTLQLI